MAVDSAAKRHASATFASHPIAYPGTAGIDVSERSQTSMLYQAATPLAVSTRLLLGVRHPRHDLGVAPSTDRCIAMESIALTDEALFEVSSSGSDLVDETAGLRWEFEIATKKDDTAWRLLEVTDLTSARTAMRIDVAGSPTRTVTVTVDSGAATETKVFHGSEIARRFGHSQRVRLAVEFIGGATVNLYAATMTAGSLEAASWELVDSTATALAALETPLTGRKILVDAGGGTHRIRFYEMRCVGIDSSALETVVATIAADGVNVGAAYVAQGLSWVVDAAATIHTYGDFDDIIADVRESSGVSWKAGRSLDQLEQITGSMSATLDNQARKYETSYASSAIYPGNELDSPLRLVSNYGGRDYSLSAVFAESWDTQYSPRGQESTTQLTCFDALGLLARSNTGGNMGVTIGALTPIGYWPLDGSGALTDDSTNSNDIDTATDVIKNWTNVLWGNEQRHALFNGSTAVLRDTAVTAATLQQTGDVSVCFSLRTSTGGDFHIMSVYGASGCFYGVELDCADDQVPLVRWIRNDGTPTSAGNDVSLSALDHGYFSDGKPHVVVCTYDQSADTLVVYVDGVVAATSVDAVPAANGDPTDSGTTELRIGLEGTHGSGATGFNGTLGHVAVFSSVLSPAEALTVTRANISGFASQSPHHRCATLLAAYGWPTSLLDIQASSSSTGTSTGEVQLTGYTGTTVSGTTTSLPIPVPDGAQVGNLIVAVIALPSNKYWKPPTPSELGFTQLIFNDQPGAIDVDLYALYKILVDGEEAGWTFTRADGGASSVFVASFDGFDTATPFTGSGTDDGATSTSVQSPSISAGLGDFLLSLHANFNSLSTINEWTSPSGLIELASLNFPYTSSSQRPNLLVAGLNALPAGATSTYTATASVTGVWCSGQVSINAAADSGVTVDTSALAAVSMTDQTFRQALLDVTSAEIGEFFACTDGVIRCSGRDWRTDNAAVVAATIGTTAGNIEFAALQFRESRDQLVNQVTVTDADGNAYTVIDETSRDKYGLYSESYDVDVTGSAAAKAWADAWLTKYKDPRKLVKVVVNPVGDNADVAFPLIGGCDLSERWKVVLTPPGGGADISEEFHIETLGGVAYRDSLTRFVIDGSPAT